MRTSTTSPRASALLLSLLTATALGAYNAASAQTSSTDTTTTTTDRDGTTVVTPAPAGATVITPSGNRVSPSSEPVAPGVNDPRGDTASGPNSQRTTDAATGSTPGSTILNSEEQERRMGTRRYPDTTAPSR